MRNAVMNQRQSLHNALPKIRTAAYRLAVGLALPLGLIATMPALADVTVVQAPLTKPPSIKPNVLLMLDDSGSMAWSVMPDDPPGDDRADYELISPSVNGVYYNPTTTYNPPYTETAHPNAATPTLTRYGAASFNAAWLDGFAGGTTVNIATYKGDNDESPGGGVGLPAFSHTFKIAIPTQYAYSPRSSTCANGSAPNSAGKCVTTQFVSEYPLCQGYGNGDYNDSSNNCDSHGSGGRSSPCSSTSRGGRTPVNSPGLNLVDYLGADKCEGNVAITNDLPCPDGGYEPNPDAAGNTANACRKQTQAALTKYRSLFVYAVKDGNTYTRHYVGAASEDTSSNGSDGSPRAGDCASISAGSVPAGATVSRVDSDGDVQESLGNGLDATLCQSDDAARQNVANWFSYYRKRMLMAKSGLMNAFATLDENIRFGFSSINAIAGGWNGNNNGNSLPDPKTSGSPPIAEVTPFGNGDTGTQRNNFWDWVKSANTTGRTPLRTALKVSGDYYTTAQPWISGAGAPECADKSGDAKTSCEAQELSCRQSYTILTTDGFWNNGDVTLDGNNYEIDDNDYDGDWDGGPGAATQKVEQVAPGCSGNYPTLQTSGFYTGYCRKGSTGRGSSCNKGSSSSYNSSCFIAGSCDSPYHYDSSDKMCERTVTESADAVTHTDPNGVKYIYTAVAPYSGGLAYGSQSTLADIAMYYWLADLRPGAAHPDTVPTNDSDPAFWQHMTTFTVGLFGQDAALQGVTPSGTTADQIFAWAKTANPQTGSKGDTPDTFAWPTPSDDSPNNISDLVHAGLNGHGGFYAAGNPDAFAAGIQDALKRVAQNIGSGASLAANSTKLDTDTMTYQAIYFTGTWKGDLRAFPVNGNGTIATSETWTASEQLPGSASRTIKTCTGNCVGSGTSVFVDFSASGTFDSKSALCVDPANCASGEADDKINYLRGDQSKEQTKGGTYRNRTALLGDIVDSQPIFVGSPNAKLYDGKSFGDTYKTFATTTSVEDRLPMLYVAANDGMVHGFKAGGDECEESDDPAEKNTADNPCLGREMFAYLPKAVIKNGIKNIALPSYGDLSNPHQYYNDGELVVSDVQISGEWKTVLVGTTGRGPAKAVYALDVTDPASIKLLWERSAGDGQDSEKYIGQIVGKPVIARVSGGSWVALMGNGYNSEYGKPALLQFDLGTGALSVYETGGSSNDGLSQAAVWIGDASLDENTSTQAYAGDLHGNVWAFDLDADGGSGSKIFTAKNSDGTKTLPITAGLVAAKNKADSSVWVFFGTGSVLSTFDVGDGVQTWYGLIVQGTNKVSATTTRADLKKRTIVAENIASDGRLASRGIPPAVDGDMAGETPAKGWYIDLLPPSGTAQGERMVTPNQFQGSLLIGTSRLPTGNADPCNPSGSGWIMAVNPFTGTPADTPFFDINNDGSFTNDAGGDNVTKDSTQYQSDGDNVVAAGVGFGSIPNNPIFVGHTMLISFDNAKTGSVNTRGASGSLKRVSWRELVTQ
jgi:type IV pilus assembly protein PilY1